MGRCGDGEDGGDGGDAEMEENGRIDGKGGELSFRNNTRNCKGSCRRAPRGSCLQLPLKFRCVCSRLLKHFGKCLLGGLGGGLAAKEIKEKL